MLKKLMNAQKEHMAKAQDKQDARVDKLESKMQDKYTDKVNELLLDGEELLKVYGLTSDFAFLTNERLVFVDGNITVKKKKVVSIFYHSIHEVSFDYGHLLGEVYVSTSHNQYDLQLLDKDMAKRFAMEIMQQMRK